MTEFLEIRFPFAGGTFECKQAVEETQGGDVR